MGYTGVISHLILTFDPNFLGHPSGCFNTIQGKSLSTNLSWSFHPTYHYDPYDHDFISFCHQVSCTCQNSWPQRNTKKIHFGKLTWPWENETIWRCISYQKRWLFHCHVEFSERYLPDSKPPNERGRLFPKDATLCSKGGKVPPRLISWDLKLQDHDPKF